MTSHAQIIGAEYLAYRGRSTSEWMMSTGQEEAKSLPAWRPGAFASLIFFADALTVVPSFK